MFSLKGRARHYIGQALILWLQTVTVVRMQHGTCAMGDTIADLFSQDSQEEQDLYKTGTDNGKSLKRN